MRRPIESDTDVDLEQLRKAKRLIRRGLRQLEEIERWLLRVRRAPRDRKPTAAEIDAAEVGDDAR